MFVRYRSSLIGKVCVATLAIAVLGFGAQQALTDDDHDDDKSHASQADDDRKDKNPRAERMFERIDSDGDGVLSKEEFTAALKKRHKRMRAMRARHRAGRGPGGHGYGHRGGMHRGPRGGGQQPIHIHHHYHVGRPMAPGRAHDAYRGMPGPRPHDRARPHDRGRQFRRDHSDRPRFRGRRPPRDDRPDREDETSALDLDEHDVDDMAFDYELDDVSDPAPQPLSVSGDA